MTFRLMTQSSQPRSVALVKVMDVAPMEGEKSGVPHSGEMLYSNGEDTLIPAGKVLSKPTSNKVKPSFGLWRVYCSVEVSPGTIWLGRKDI